MIQEWKKEQHYSEADYLLVLQPHRELWDEIIQQKKLFAKKFDCPMAEKGLPHITLVRFMQLEIFETRIVQRWKNIASTLSPFKVELKDFGSFPSHTIYINITSKVNIVDAVKALRQPQKLMKMDKDHKPHFITEPHLTIARKLLPWQYEKAWLEYEHAHFHGRFIADHALLLKRKPNEPYRQLANFKFESAKTEVEQQSLF